MASLLDQATADPIGGLMSLLTPFVSGGALTPPQGQLLTPDQMDQSTPAWLAFAQRMANAGAPTLGPPTTFGQALTGAMGAGYTAERQAQMLPFLTSAAQREQEAAQLALDKQKALQPYEVTAAQQGVAETALKLEQAAKLNPLAVQAAGQGVENTNLDLARKAYDLKTHESLGNLQRSMINQLNPDGTPNTGAGAGPTGGAQTPPAVPVPGTGPRSDLGPAAGGAELAALPDVRRLPDQTRIPFIQAVAQAGMPAPVAAQYARMVMAEGQGLHIDPDTGKPWVSSAGAVGAAQVMPGTFRDMQNKYGFQGNLTDLMPNLLAGSHYFMDQVGDHGMHGGTIAYNAGPGGLQRYLASGKMPAETADYLAQTGAPGPDGITPSGTAMASGPTDLAPPTLRPIQVAGPGAPTEPDAPANVAPPVQAALVRDPLSGAMVPPEVLRTARAAILSGEGEAGFSAYNKVINDYVSKMASQPSEVFVSQDEVTAINRANGNILDPRMAYLKKLAPDGKVLGYEALAPRQAFAQQQQETDLRTEYLNHPAVAPYQAAIPIVGRMQATLAAAQHRELQQPDDMALVQNFAKLNNPTGVVKAGDVDDVMAGAGIPGDIKQAWARVKGGGVLTDDQRQWIMDTAHAELGGMAAGALPVLLEKRRIAGLYGVRPDAIGIPEQLGTDASTAVRATPPGATRPGMPTGTPPPGGGIERPGFAAPSGALPSGPALAGPSPLPTAPAPAAPNTGPPAKADRLAPGQGAALSPAGFKNIIADFARNPGAYSMADRQQLEEYIQKHPSSVKAK